MLIGKSTVKYLVDEAKRLNLDGVELLDSIPESRLSDIYNGVGPDRFPWILRVILSICNICILPAVLIHDVEFSIGGTEDDFHHANIRLYNNAKTCILDKFNDSKFLESLGFTKVALFAKLCNIFGRRGWKFTDGRD